MSDWIPEEVRTEHRRLKALFASTQEALRGDDAAEAIEAVTALREALDVHFEQEDALYYPTILALRPEHGERLRACMDAHEEFRTRLVRLVESTRTGPLEEALRILDEIAEGFARHESAEEQVLAALERDAPTAVR